MALDRSALIELLEALDLTDVDHRFRTETACVRPGDPPLAAELAAEVTDDLVRDGTAADANESADLRR